MCCVCQVSAPTAASAITLKWQLGCCGPGPCGQRRTHARRSKHGTLICTQLCLRQMLLALLELPAYVLVQSGPFKFSEAVRLQAIGPGQQPSAATVGSSCVYICQRSDGFFYCGQTDDIRGASFNAASAEMY